MAGHTDEGFYTDASETTDWADQNIEGNLNNR
jgi:hypothetical protein